MLEKGDGESWASPRRNLPSGRTGQTFVTIVQPTLRQSLELKLGWVKGEQDCTLDKTV